MWMIIDIIIKWIAIAGIPLVLGIVICSFFNDSYMILCAILFLAEVSLVAICFYKGFSLRNIILVLLGALICIFYIRSISKIPKAYRSFYVVENSLMMGTGFAYSYPILCYFLMLPELLSQLPVRIEHFERYAYFDFVCIIFYLIQVLSKDVNIPNIIRKWIEDKDVITQDMIEKLINQLMEKAADEGGDPDDMSAYVYNTLADFAKEGILEIDDENHCFRKKGKSLKKIR